MEYPVQFRERITPPVLPSAETGPPKPVKQFRRRFFPGSRLRYYLPVFTARRVFNVLAVTGSYYLSRLLGRHLVWGQPLSYFVEPTNLCNLRCTECPVGLKQLSRPQGLMDGALYRRILEQIAPTALHVLLYFQGESFIHPQIIEFIRAAVNKHLLVEISTNGTRLANREFAEQLVRTRLWRLVVSVDGASEETYQIYRQKGHFHRVLKGIQHVVSAKQRFGQAFPQVILQFLVMRHNEHEIPAIKALGRRLGVDRVVLKSPQIYHFSDAETILPSNPRYRRYEKVNGSYRLKGSFSGYCRKLWIGSVITQDGQVLPCCFDKDATYCLGSVTESSLKAIWHSSNTISFRKRVIRHREKIPMCRNCSEGLKIFF